MKATKGKKTAVKRTDKKSVAVAKKAKAEKKPAMKLYSETELSEVIGCEKKTIECLRRTGFIRPFKVASRVNYYTEKEKEEIYKMFQSLLTSSLKYFILVDTELHGKK